jgi:rare lipoprotein A
MLKNDEFRMTTLERNPNAELERLDTCRRRLNSPGRARFPVLYRRCSQLRFRTSLIIRHWSFVILLALFLTNRSSAAPAVSPPPRVASWYGEEHRGRLMANGKRFNPDKLTAASWFYPLGTRVRVTLDSPSPEPRSVVVKITDRGPAKELVRDGRIIDLARAAFKQLAHPGLGLVAVRVEPVR